MKVRTENVSKIFQSKTSQVTALENVSFEVASGEFVCILGPSGCGKSTLLNIIAGLDHADSGAIFCDDRAVQDTNTDRIVMFQEAALFPWLDVIGNVEFGLRVSGIAAPERRARAERYLAMVHLTRFARANVHELSGGMKQRVALARALALEPAVLLMDEPFAALDAQTREMLQEEILSIWRQSNRTVLFITHSVQEAVYLGSRIAVMTARPGRIKTIIDVGLPYPRDVTSAEFGNLMKPVYAVLKDEVLKAAHEAALVPVAEASA
jgi:NitT/TauT family transport system ATP-binding protein